MKNQFKKTLMILLASLTTHVFADQVDSGKIYFHLNFPVSINEQTEAIHLNDNFKDLMMSNMVAGAMYTHLIQTQFPKLKFNREYLAGSLFSQLLQENLQTSDYQATSDWINPNKDIRNMLLMPGQGGPYQLNDYSKRLENKIGMINFAVLQKSLGYTIQDQDSGAQTNKKGPETLANKYFGPLAAAYFQYNDMLRLQAINHDTWGPSAKHYEACMENLKNIPNNFFDMILNATYNAGPWADITKTYFELCAHYTNPEYAEKINHINDYTLTDKEYQHAIGTKESAGSTFILYPRQIRFYLDELYNSAMIFPMPLLKTVFSKSMSTLSYVNDDGKFVFINSNDAERAFDAAITSLNLSNEQSLNISDRTERNKLFDVLETAIANLSHQLKIDFTEVTEINHR